jgi:23S rRNA (uracil1939-C5)-methyltransferase
LVRWLQRVPGGVPSCRHFGTCGGCRLQHLEPDDYRQWIETQVETALARRGLGDARVRAALITAPGTRRRLRLAFERTGTGLRLGLRAAGSNRIVELEECPVAAPALAQALGPLRDLLRGLDAMPHGEALLTQASSGLELVLITDGPLDLDARARLARAAQQHDFARIAWTPSPGEAPEPVAERRPVRVAFGDISVDLPPAAFLQASEAAEAMIRAAVEEALSASARVLDLFSGCGTLGLPLAALGAVVHAVDGDAPMLAALAAAARRSGLAGRVTVEQRNLARRPLSGAELQGFTAAIVDPPRGGARAQAEALAAAPIARLAMVSCHPPSLARDAAILVGGGYRLLWVQPVGAFLWSAEIELVAALERVLEP